MVGERGQFTIWRIWAICSLSIVHWASLAQGRSMETASKCGGAMSPPASVDANRNYLDVKPRVGSRPSSPKVRSEWRFNIYVQCIFDIFLQCSRSMRPLANKSLVSFDFWVSSYSVPWARLFASFNFHKIGEGKITLLGSHLPWKVPSSMSCLKQIGNQHAPRVGHLHF